MFSLCLKMPCAEMLKAFFCHSTLGAKLKNHDAFCASIEPK